MSNFEKYVIYLIDKDGNEFNVPVSEKYHKHIQAFKKLQLDNPALNLDKYIKYKGTNNITGYELASFLGANGSIVFFHTDVANYLKGKKEGSIIIPTNLTDIQNIKLLELIDNLKKEEFTFYITESKFKNNKSFKIVHTPTTLALFLKKDYNSNVESRNIKCKTKKIIQ